MSNIDTLKLLLKLLGEILIRLLQEWLMKNGNPGSNGDKPPLS